MKLIIEISKEDFTLIRSVNSSNVLLLAESRAMLAVKNGKPLDKIRADIELKCDRINTLAASELSYPEHREIQELLHEIMDLYKKESEV